MTELVLNEAPIDRRHDREAFDCGDRELDLYLAKFARQNHASGGAKTFVVTAPHEPALILGFYSLSPASLSFARTPAVVSRGLGRYDAPMFRLGRIAVDRSIQGQGVGGRLLFAAGRRCIAVAEEIGGVAMLIDAKDEQAAAWYERFGALRLADASLSLVLPLAMIARAAVAAG